MCRAVQPCLACCGSNAQIELGSALCLLLTVLVYHAAAFLLQDQLLDRQRSTPAMATDRFNPDKHWRKSTQWFVLNRRWAAGEGGLLGVEGGRLQEAGQQRLHMGWLRGQYSV